MKKEYLFDSPEMIVILTEKKKKNRVEKYIEAALKQIDEEYTTLTVAVPKKHLDKILKVLKLMDVKGAYITEEHLKNSDKFMDGPKSDSLSNVIVQKKNRFIGHTITPPLDRPRQKAEDLSESIVKAVKIWTGKTVDKAKLIRSIKKVNSV